MRRRDARSVDAYRVVLAGLQRVARGEEPGDPGSAPPPPHLRIVQDGGAAAARHPEPRPDRRAAAAVHPSTAEVGTKSSGPMEPRRMIFVDDAVARGADARVGRLVGDGGGVERDGRTVPAVAPPSTPPTPPGTPTGTAVEPPPEPRTLVIIDEGAADVPRAAEAVPPSGLAPISPSGVLRRRQGRSHGSRAGAPGSPGISLFRLAASALVVACLALGTALVLQRTRHPSTTPRPPASASRPPTVSPRPISVTPPSTSPSTITRPSLVATGSSRGSAAYATAAPTVQVSLAATQRSWIELHAGSRGGSVVFAGIVSSGDEQIFTGLPGFWVRIGFPSGVSLHVDGVGIDLPADGPFDVTVETAPITP